MSDSGPSSYHPASIPPPSTLPPPPGVRHVIAVVGGRGGVGASSLSINLGVYLAQLGRKVLLIDADPTGAELHTLLGLELPPLPDTDEDPDDLEIAPLQTRVPGLVLLPQGYRVGSTLPIRPGRKPRWARRLRQLNVDYVLLDLGAGTAPSTLDLFLTADQGVCVTTPEPPSVEATYRFLSAVFLRSVRRSLVEDRYRMRLVERAQSELGALPSPLHLVRTIARYDSAVSARAAAELAQLRPRLVVNNVRLRTDSDLGPAMVDMARRYLGVKLDYVGHIEQDDAVWLSVVRRRPLLIDSPTSKSARNTERIARRILALASARSELRSEPPLPIIAEEPNLYDVLWTHRGATDEELRRAYKRQRDIYTPGSLPLTSLLGEEELKREQARIEEAHETLLDPLRRKAYDASVFREDTSSPPRAPMPRDAALEAERALLRQELSREISAETEFTGRLLGKVREAQGIEIEDIAKHTRISIAHLKAIESEAFSELPALVYTRGFVQQLAKFLKLDPTQVSRTYLHRMREAVSRPDEESSS
ncbi:MAG TPA: helix-turn-helix domain-containing protein [Polyangiaceae bacterium]|nr:helix-turn-helix domain-containing protein [Polyangiaceae bacterium]